MAKYRVTLEDGRNLEIEAASPQDADKAAGEYLGANPPKPSMARDFVRPIKRAWGTLRDETSADYAEAGRVAQGKGSPVSATDLGPGPRLAKNLFGLAMSPVQGAVDATVARPAARAAIGAGLPVYERSNPFRIQKAPPTRIYGEQAEEAVAGDVNLALMGARAPSLGGRLTAMRPNPPPPPKPAPPPPRMKPGDLKVAKTKAYQAAENADVRYTPDAADSLVQGIADEMAAARLRPRRHPNAASVLDDDIMPLRGTSPTLQDLDDLRAVIREDVIQSGSRAERRLGTKMIKNIDEFIGAAGPEQVTAGDAATGAAAIRKARDLNVRFRKVEDIEGAVESARLRAGSTGSGGNVDNATRQNLRRVLEDGTWTPEEALALEEVVMGGKAQNLLRLIGKLSPQGNGLMTAFSIGGAAANPFLAIPGMAGVFAKMGADAMTARKVKQLLELIAAGPAPTVARTAARLPSAQPAAAGATVANLFAPRETQRTVQAGR